MQYAIELFFDKETEASLFGLAKKVADANLSTKYLEWKTRPHVTLACFNDVDEEDWYYEYINIAYSNGIVNGKGDVFSPNENITREDATVIMYRLLSKNHPIASGNASFIDKADISDYAKEAIGGMKNEGIIEGVGKNRFEPKSPITRAQCATLINRCMLRFEITE